MKTTLALAALLVIHTPRLDAFHAALRTCNDELSAAAAAAKNAPRGERKKLLRAAKAAYKRCEAHAEQVFKYWPNQPPE